jgi:hypothetical protein
VISPGAEGALAALNEILEIDGGRLVVESATPTSLGLRLDLTGSSCPECVVPRDLMLDILRANLATADPDIRAVEVHDPRETGELPPTPH